MSTSVTVELSKHGRKMWFHYNEYTANRRQDATRVRELSCSTSNGHNMSVVMCYGYNFCINGVLFVEDKMEDAAYVFKLATGFGFQRVINAIGDAVNAHYDDPMTQMCGL